MKATIWHNPRCSKSRQALAILEETPGIDVEIVEYLKTPPSRAELAAVYARGGISPRDAYRKGEEEAQALNLAEADDNAILDAMAAHPILIERPVVITEKGVRIAATRDDPRDSLNMVQCSASGVRRGR